jgi:hypothetical protein
MLLVMLCSMTYFSNAQNTNPWPSTGSVGIGLTNPYVPLHINSNTANTHVGITGTAPSLKFGDSPINVGKAVIGYGTAAGQFGITSIASGDLMLGTFAPGGLSFVTTSTTVSPNTAERFRIDGNGNLQVGVNTTANTTSAITTKLLIQENNPWIELKDATFNGGAQDATSVGLKFTTGSMNFSISGSPTVAGYGLLLKDNSATPAPSIFMRSGQELIFGDVAPVLSAQYTTKIQFKGNTGFADNVAVLGKIFIGNGSAMETFGTEKFEVKGNIKTTGLILPTNAATGKVLTSDASGNATWQTASGGSGSWTINGNDQYNNNTGNVGIGVTAPTSKFEVGGVITSQGLSVGVQNASSTVATATTKLLLQEENPWIELKDMTYVGGVQDASTVGIKLSTSNSNFSITNGLVGATNGFAIKDNSITNPAPPIFMRPGEDLVFGALAPVLSPQYNSKIQFSGNVGMSNNLVTLGKVLIGDGSAAEVFGTERFEVKGNIKSTGLIIPTNAAAGKVLTSDANGMAAWADATGGSSAWTVNANNMYNSNAGNIGIGTAAPASTLHVAGILTATGITMTQNAGAGKVLVSDATGNASWQAAPNSSYWYNNGTHTIVDNTHNIGIGVSTPSANLHVGGTTWLNGSVYIGNGPGFYTNSQYALAVQGKVLTDEVTVKFRQNWPDYVFDEKYKLIDLDSLEMYIIKNNHLPDMPSAKVIEREGVALGDMNAILLKKIEELTLYSIEQNKKIQMMGNRLHELEEKK